MQTGSLRDDWLFPFIIITVIYSISFGLTIYWLLPVQQKFVPEMAAFASLLFLPHGVRVLSAWLLGWKSIVLIAPVALFTHWLIFGAEGFSALGILGAMSGVICAATSFWLLAKAGLDFQVSNSKAANWRDIMVAGCLASVINTLGIGWMLGLDTTTMTGYLLGDVSGLFACMFILMLTFKALRIRHAQS